MSNANRKWLEPGDVIEFEIDDSYSYIQYIGRHTDYGDVIWVIPELFKVPAKSHEFLSKSDGYIAFYSATQSTRQGLTKLVGKAELPREIRVPTTLRRAGARGDHGAIHTWVIEHEGVDTLKRKLSIEERALPIAAIWNHEILKIRVLQNWRPENEGFLTSNDCNASVELDDIPNVDKPQCLVHYFYFPSKELCNSASQELVDLGFKTKSRISADKNNWLLLATTREIRLVECISNMRSKLESLAKLFSGEYDGWELEVAK